MAKEQPRVTREQAVEQLLNNGPATQEEIGYSNMARLRSHGVGRLHVTMTAPTLGYGHQTPVYYIRGEHSKEEIVRVYLRVNPKLTEDKSQRQLVLLFRRAGPGFKSAMQEISDEYDLRSQQSGDGKATGDSQKDCPYCGETVDVLANHIRRYCSEV